MKHLGIPEGSRFYAGMTGMPMLALVGVTVSVACMGDRFLFMAGWLGVFVPRILSNSVNARRPFQVILLLYIKINLIT